MSEPDALDFDVMTDAEFTVHYPDLPDAGAMTDEEFAVHLARIGAEPTECERLAPVLRGCMAVELARLVLHGDAPPNLLSTGVQNA